ncbi:MAG: hypothetical protein ACRELY_24830 [Polyangiaceae bacterium]
MQHPLVRRALIAATLCVCACDPYTRTTVIQARDPGQVAVEDVDSPSRVAPGESATEPAEVARTEVAIGPSSTSDLLVTATRRPGGGLVTEWQTRLPLVNGERHTLVDANGTATLDEHIDIDTSHDDVVIPVCGVIGERYARNVLVGYEVRPAVPCESQHMTQINLVTPKRNIEAIHHVSVNDNRAVAIVGVVIATVIVGGVGSIFTFADLKDKDGSDAGPVPKVIGVGLLSLAAGVDIALFPSVFAPNKDTVVFPASP